MVKPASAKKPHHEVLDYEPPIQEGPSWVKHPVREFKYSPEKSPGERWELTGESVLMDHAWRKKTRRENPREYRAAKALCKRTPMCPPLSSPSHSSEEEDRPKPPVKRSRGWMELQEVLRDDMDSMEKITTPFTRLDGGCWAYLRNRPGVALPRCEFKEWENTRSKVMLQKGASLIRGRPGPAFDYYKEKSFKKYLDCVLKSEDPKWDTLGLAIHGRRDKLAGFW
jgi:hypothetical protein